MKSGGNRQQLRELLAGFAQVRADQDCEVSGLTEDSREIAPGMLFFARQGGQLDGVNFIPEAIAGGASAVVLSQSTHRRLPIQARSIFAVEDVVDCLGAVSDRFYGNPSTRMTVIGVTGTNGKTSIAHFISQLLNAEETCAACHIIGTLGSGPANTMVPASLTTPSTVALHRRLADFVSDGAQYAVLEVSSHALAQRRVAGVHFRIAVFSNLTREHLDYHGSFEAYGLAKHKLFEIESLSHAIINIDDPFGEALVSSLHERLGIITYSVTSPDQGTDRARLVGHIHEHDTEHLTLNVFFDNQALGRVRTRLVGTFNAANLLAALAVGLVLGIPVEALSERAQHIRAVCGRMQRMRSEMGDEPTVFVDYAHTPDALQQALQTLRQIAPDQVIWCVFGCAGDRDQGKRQEMARVAEARADRIILTSDNPRSEKAGEILVDLLSGFKHPEAVWLEEERSTAIARAVLTAGVNDIVLVAGKGHETYQEIAGVHHPLVDQRIVLDALQERHA